MIPRLPLTCPPSPAAVAQACDPVFAELGTLPDGSGGFRFFWSLDPSFPDPGPYTAQLETAPAGVEDADAWCPVGDPVEGQPSEIVDHIQRSFGPTTWNHYRIRLTTPLDEYVSPAIPATGALDRRYWLHAREILRGEKLRLRQTAEGVEGWLIKRRLFGPPCSCVNRALGTTAKPHCDLCYGTGITGGYYNPIPDFWAQIMPDGFRSHLGDNGRGVVESGHVVAAEMINSPQVYSYDVFAEKRSAQRWAIHSIKVKKQIRNVPLLLGPVEMRLLPRSDPVYKIALTA